MARNEDRRWDFSVNQFTPNNCKSINRIDNCFTIVATIIGDTNAKVNGKMMFASATPATDSGDTMTFTAKKDDIYAGYIRVEFLQPLGTNPLIEIIQAFYIDEQ